MEEEKCLYQTVYDDLLERIRSGKIRPGERLPAEKALAEEFDVSRITIQKAMSMLVQDGYIVRRPGRGSFTSMNAGKADAKSGERGTDAGGMSRVIGLVMEEFTASFGIEMLKAIEEEAEKKGYHLCMKRSCGDQLREKKMLESLMRMKVAGTIVMPTHGQHYNTEILKMVGEGMPVVFVDRYLEGLPVPYIGTDNKKAMEELVQYLEQADCHRLGRTADHPHGPEHVGIDDVRSIVEHAVIAYQGVDHAKVPVEDLAHRHDGQHDHRGHQHRDGDIAAHLPAVGAVDGSRAVELVVESGDGRQVNDHLHAQIFPHFYDDQDHRPVFCLHIEIDLIHPDGSEDIIQNPVLASDNAVKDVADDRPGQEIRQQITGLSHLFELLPLDLFIKDIMKNPVSYLMLLPAAIYSLLFGYCTIPYMVIAFQQFRKKSIVFLYNLYLSCFICYIWNNMIL